jgi:hypothetical protein
MESQQFTNETLSSLKFAVDHVSNISKNVEEFDEIMLDIEENKGRQREVNQMFEGNMEEERNLIQELEQMTEEPVVK